MLGPGKNINLSRWKEVVPEPGDKGVSAGVRFDVGDQQREKTVVVIAISHLFK